MDKHCNIPKSVFCIGSFLTGLVLATGVDNRSAFTSTQYQQVQAGQVIKPANKNAAKVEKEAFYEQFYRH